MGKIYPLLDVLAFVILLTA